MVHTAIADETQYRIQLTVEHYVRENMKGELPPCHTWTQPETQSFLAEAEEEGMGMPDDLDAFIQEVGESVGIRFAAALAGGQTTPRGDNS